jgi:hypothetical protein
MMGGMDPIDLRDRIYELEPDAAPLTMFGPGFVTYRFVPATRRGRAVYRVREASRAARERLALRIAPWLERW